MNDYEMKQAISLQGQMGNALGPGTPYQVTVADNLKQQLAHHHRESTRIEKLLSLLERNPDTEEILNLMRGLI